MNLSRFLPAALLVAGCASLPEQEGERPSQVGKDPARIHGFFIQKIREREEKKAAAVTTLNEDAFYFGVRNQIAPDLTRRILLGFEQHDVKVAEDRSTATVRWCNPEFGISHHFTMRSEFGGRLWKLEISVEQIEEFARAGLRWFERQREAADGRIYAYPPDWKAARVSPRCPCGR
jgi:hypothetical protein